MNFANFIFISFLTMISIESTLGQAFYDTSNYYNESFFTGNSINGHRIGKWIESSSTGIIYAEYNYDSLGIPIGTFVINTSEGTKRFETDYSQGKVVSSRIYRNNQKLIEIIPNDYLSVEIYNDIRRFEDSEYSTPEKSIPIGNSQSVLTFKLIYFNYFIQLIDLLIHKKYSGTFIGYDDYENIRRKYNFKNGNYEKTVYIHSSSGKRLKKKMEYNNEILIRTTTYNKKGEITKIEE